MKLNLKSLGKLVTHVVVPLVATAAANALQNYAQKKLTKP